VSEKSDIQLRSGEIRMKSQIGWYMYGGSCLEDEGYDGFVYNQFHRH